MTSVEALTLFVFRAIVEGAAPSHEAEDVARIRFASIADAIVNECARDSDDSEGQAYCAATLLAIGRHESGGWQEGVGTGRVRGDDGRSCGYHQVQIGRRLCDAIGRDVRATTAIAWRRAEQSYGACGDLTAYCSGRCKHGRKEARRMARSRDRYFGAAIIAIKEAS